MIARPPVKRISMRSKSLLDFIPCWRADLRWNATLYIVRSYIGRSSYFLSRSVGQAPRLHGSFSTVPSDS